MSLFLIKLLINKSLKNKNMQNFIKLVLLASGLAILLDYPMGSLILSMPSLLLAPFNYLNQIGIEASFVLGFFISIILLLLLQVPQRYPHSKGFILLGCGLVAYILFQIFKLEISISAMNQLTLSSYRLKYVIELIVFSFISVGMILIYRSNMPRPVEAWKNKKAG
jgi:hypothetical protein